MIRLLALALAGLAAAAPAGQAPSRSAGQPAGLAARDSFRVGSAGVLCTAQARPEDPALSGTFDRAHLVTCRDAVAPVAKLYALRSAADRLPALLAARPEGLDCRPARDELVEGLGTATLFQCDGRAAGVPYRAYAVRRGRTQFVALGLAGYDPALRLGLRSLVADRPVEGAVEVATTAAGDPAAFARVQAGALDPGAALAEAYGRNNAGAFAESAEFFETLGARADDPARPGAARPGETLIGEAAQRSNLGDFAAAAAAFERAEAAGAARDPVTARLLRNQRATDALNRRDPAGAIAALDRPVPPPGGGADAEVAQGVIAPPLAREINTANAAVQRLTGGPRRLQPAERAAILDAQGGQLRGTALRLQGRYPESLAALADADRRLNGVRGGRVASAAFLRSEGAGEVARVAEAESRHPEAERAYGESIRVLEVDLPRSAALLAARARFAGYLARREDPRALPMFAAIVGESRDTPGSAVALREPLRPYLALLAPRVSADPAAADAMFAAAQLLVRPGVAQTQAVLARELSAGDDAAAALFRRSVTLSRQASVAAGDVARLAATADEAQAAALAEARARLSALEAEQTAVQAGLSAYPRYRVLAPETLPLAELRRTLRPDEGYYLLRAIGRDVYAMLVTPTAASAFRLDADADALGREVAALRDSVATVVDGRTEVRPFDLALARRLHVRLFGPVAPAMAGVRHLVFEPDGPLLQLPPTLLVADQAGVDAYAARASRPGADPFDYRGVRWLGRDVDVTTAVSPRAFADVRAAAPSKAPQAYLGLGENAVPSAAASLLSAAPARGDCDWPIEAWGRPIAATELRLASRMLGPDRSAVVTGAAFTDTGLAAAGLERYRVLHFATHGLVTAPRPHCVARPALITSFGDGASDGLLSFREIYDLRLDADLVILSACDTAGAASAAATREAGVATGGGFALDGLVRAFVGAGARTVVASHWPIPDDYGATERLMRGLFSAAPGVPVATALRSAQRGLMDGAETSHPFYWAAFAIVGDGERPLLRN